MHTLNFSKNNLIFIQTFLTLSLQGKVSHFISHGTSTVCAASTAAEPDCILLLIHIHKQSILLSIDRCNNSYLAA